MTAIDADQARDFDDAGAARFLVFRIEDAAQRAEGSRIDEVQDAFPDAHPAPVMQRLQRDAHVLIRSTS